ncbi:hypothetical protein Daus18300_000938 [Diaporthe australafricana]|uniref:Acyltransferase 3 domain-containing protein n=1 Tax=Diaporthe australafricana TaxID=127596 RepID=A0ABR3Y2A3_9PEZI
MMGRAQADSEEEAIPETSTEWLGERIRSEKKPREGIQWARVGWSMLPWIITAPLGKSERTLPKANSTSYLNGLRGVACVIVYNYHVAILWNPPFKRDFGAVPFFNVVLAGHGATMVFFVLSGFVLSFSPLSKITSGQPDTTDSALLTSLWSSTIRRGIRLFTPLVALATLLFFITFFTSVYPPARDIPWATVEPKTVGAFFAHMSSYAQMVALLMDPFTWSTLQPATLEQAWTLPFEYRGSLVIFLLCIACSRLTPGFRKLLLLLFGLWALHWIRWDVFCFTAGMGLAELRFSPLMAPCPPEQLPRSTPGAEGGPVAFTAGRRRPWDRLVQSMSVRSIVALVALVPAITICAWPEGGAVLGVEPFATIHAIFTPAHYRGADVDFLYASVGAFAVLASLEALPQAQWLLSTAPFRYLGEISFSFYLLHLLMINIFAAKALIYLSGSWGLSDWSAYVVMWLFTAAAVVLAADLFWRGVDEVSVKLSRRVSDWLIARPRDTETAYHAL